MAHFNYVAKDSSGKAVKGKEFAVNERELIMRLARRNLTIISVKQAKESKIFAQLTSRTRPISIFNQMVFCRQLATLLKGGVPLIRGLEIISSETENPSLRIAITEMAYYIKQGDSFSDALKKMPQLFSTLFTAIVQAGEKVGALDTMLERLAKYLAAQDRLNKKIISAISYPTVVFIFFLGAIGVMTLFLIPKFKSMYSSFNAALPPFTLAVFGLSDFLIRYIGFIVAAIFVLIVYIRNVVLRTIKGRRAFDQFMLNLPIFGNILKKAALSKFSRTLATLLGQGIPVPESLELVRKTSGNAVVEEATVKAMKSILDGEKIAEALRKTGVFPPLILQMAMIGTESGNLPELLDKTADFYEEEIDIFVGIMSSLIEPLLIVVLGIILGIFIVALYLPIFTLSSAMGKGV